MTYCNSTQYLSIIKKRWKNKQNKDYLNSNKMQIADLFTNQDILTIMGKPPLKEPEIVAECNKYYTLKNGSKVLREVHDRIWRPDKVYLKHRKNPDGTKLEFDFKIR